MDSEKIIFLKPNIHAVPLVSKWYAWHHLIYPLTAACHIVRRHLPIIESFLDDPETHLEACSNPEMIGGPFMDVPITELENVKIFLNQTNVDCSQFIEIFKDLGILFEMLHNQTGDTLEGLYKDIPANFKGCTEISYDLFHHAYPRFLESQVYRKFSTSSLHETILFEHNQDKRPFVLSTPLVCPTSEHISIKKPFNKSEYDILYSSRFIGTTEDALRKANLFDNQSFDKVLHLFTDEVIPLAQDREWLNDEEIRVRYFGHACVLIQANNKSLMIDPFISYKYKYELDRFTYYDLPSKIDYVCITHGHQDHFQLETLLNLRHKIGTIIVPRCSYGSLQDPSMKNTLIELGFQNVVEMDEFEQFDSHPFQVISVPFLGEHGDLSISAKSGYVVMLGSRKIFFAVDSNNFENALYENLYNKIGKIDELYIGMECQGAPMSWLYGPLMMQKLHRTHDNARRLSGSDSIKAINMIEILKPQTVYVYAMGLEPWLSHIMGMHLDYTSLPITESNILIEWCQEKNIKCERLFAMKETILSP